MRNGFIFYNFHRNRNTLRGCIFFHIGKSKLRYLTLNVDNLKFEAGNVCIFNVH